MTGFFFSSIIPHPSTPQCRRRPRRRFWTAMVCLLLSITCSSTFSATAAANLPPPKTPNGEGALPNNHQRRDSSTTTTTHNKVENNDDADDDDALVLDAAVVVALHFDRVFSLSSPTNAPANQPQEQRRRRRERRQKYSFRTLRRAWTAYFYTKAPSATDAPIQHSNTTIQALYPPQLQRTLEDAAAATDDAAAANDDASSSSNNNNNNNNGGAYMDDMVAGDSELCSQYLISFLEGTTDARDTCEGIMNAFTAAECSSSSSSSGSSSSSSSSSSSNYYDENSNEHQCCQTLQTHHSDYCEGEDNLLSNFHLFVTVTVLLLCECAKAIVTRLSIHFLPEAAVCIMVGTTVGLLAHLAPKQESWSIDDLSFDDELFLSLLLPPIIFEAALSVSKMEFRRRRGAIFMFSVLGTLISTFTAGLMVHYISKLSNATTFPMLDSLVFGALISSIDPVAILSVLTSLQMDQKDTIFILVFGESLLNDGIAITVFQTLADRFDGKTNVGTTSVDEVLDAVATFLIAMFGSIAVGLACGCGAWVYFNLLGAHLPPVMEVGSFFLWALMPYYICDGVGWSGIVAIVAVGFFMDVYIAGPKHDRQHSYNHNGGGFSPSGYSVSAASQSHRSPAAAAAPEHRLPSRARMQQQRERDERSNPEFYHNMRDDDYYCSDDRGVCHDDGTGQWRNKLSCNRNDVVDDDDRTRTDISVESLPTAQSISPLPSTERIHLSATADKHVRFVAHLTSQLAENAIFAYLGLFLFSNNYDWNPTLISISIVSCVLSRTFMVIVVSYLIFHVYRCRGAHAGTNSSRTAAAIQEPRTQAVLVLAGLRGAVSLALVENVPIYNNTTGEGCEFKQTMKGMTSACILFTTFVFGGGAYYVLPHLGIRRDECSSVCSVSSPHPRKMSPVPPTVPELPLEDAPPPATQHQETAFSVQNTTATIS